MKNLWRISFGIFCFAALIAGWFSSRAVRAQVSTTTIDVGINSSLKVDAGKFWSVPPCSLAANCTSQLQLCNENPDGTADSRHCIFIAGDGQSPWASYLWVGTSETTPNSTGGTSTTPYGFATLRVSVPNDEINIVP